MDWYSARGERYLLLPEPTDMQLRARPEALCAGVLVKWAAHGEENLPPMETCVAALKLAYRHFNCPLRKRKLPQGNAVAWACTEFDRFCMLWVTGRPDPTGTFSRLSSLNPLTRGVACASSETSSVNLAQPSKSMRSPIPTEPTPSVSVADLGELWTSEAPSQLQAPLSPSSLAESDTRLAKTGLPNSNLGGEKTEPNYKLKAIRRRDASAL